MRILLVGEFSRLHNSLKEGLIATGHRADLVGSGDDFKQLPVDFSIAAKSMARFALLRSLNKISNKVFSLDLSGFEKAWRFYRLLPKMKGYDVVQLINSDALECPPKIAQWLLGKLFAQNGKKFLLVCGDETPIIDVLLKNNLKYSVMTPYFEASENKKYYNYSLKFATSGHRKLFHFIQENCDGIFASDLDYKVPLEQSGIPFVFIPNPVNVDKISFEPIAATRQISIFHGVNKFSHKKKGNAFFAEALDRIREKYPEKTKIIAVNSIPYSEYEKLLSESHIVLDQVYSFDQGYNALEAMAKGKVVFTGAETEFYDHFKLAQKVAINALPDTDYLVAELSKLIENPEEIAAIGKRARQFIEKEHDYRKIAAIYLQNWAK